MVKDLAMHFSLPKKSKPSNDLKRSTPITIAALISWATGVLGLGFCIFVLVLYVQNTLDSYPYWQFLYSSIGHNVVYLGAVATVLSIIHLIVGFLLWRPSKYGGMVGITLAACDIAIYSISLFVPALVFIVLPALLVGTAMAICIIFGWDTFHSTTIPGKPPVQPTVPPKPV